MGFTTSIAFITHAISLDQACAQCPIFPTAAARKRLGRVSVPVWPIVLSNQLGIYGLVRLYHTNYLIPRKLIPYRYISRYKHIRGISPPVWGRFSRVTHPYARIHQGTLRLACVMCIASVHSEPGSNSYHIVSSGNTGYGLDSLSTQYHEKVCTPLLQKNYGIYIDIYIYYTYCSKAGVLLILGISSKV
nr:hypothetical protein [Picochlorum sp. 'soloecismus']